MPVLGAFYNRALGIGQGRPLAHLGEGALARSFMYSAAWRLTGLTAFCSTLACASTEPSPFTPREVIYFSCSTAGAVMGVCRVSPSGSGFGRVADTAGGQPTVSPDGSTIAYVCYSETGGSGICMMAPDGSDKRRVIDAPPSNVWPRWSPDGRLAFVRAGEIWVSNADGTDQVQLTHIAGDDASMALDWSPDGQRIVFGNDPFTADTSAVEALWIMNADGSDLHVLVDLPGTEATPRWSPDGGRIIFAMRHELDPFPKVDLFVYDVATQQSTRLTTFGTVATPAWSPDGSRIAFQGSVEPTGSQLFVMKADGTNATNVTKLTYQSMTAGSPDWVVLPAGE